MLGLVPTLSALMLLKLRVKTCKDPFPPVPLCLVVKSSFSLLLAPSAGSAVCTSVGGTTALDVSSFPKKQAKSQGRKISCWGFAALFFLVNEGRKNPSPCLVSASMLTG